MKQILFTLILSTLILSLTPQGLSAPRGSQEVREWIEDTIAQRHPKDRAEDWRALGETGWRTILTLLEELSSDQGSLSRRHRLVGALSWYDAPEVVDYLKKEADKKEQRDVLRTAAIHSLGTSQGEKELSFIQKFLDHPDVDTRVMAAQAVAQMGTPTARARLNAYLLTEKVAWARARATGGPLPAAPGVEGDVKGGSVDPAGLELLKGLFGEWKGTLSWSGKTAAAVNAQFLKAESPLVNSSYVPFELRLNGKRGFKVLRIVKESLGGKPRYWVGDWSSSDGLSGKAQIEAFEISGTWWLEVRFSTTGSSGVFLGKR